MEDTDYPYLLLPVSEIQRQIVAVGLVDLMTGTPDGVAVVTRRLCMCDNNYVCTRIIIYSSRARCYM